LEDSFRNYFTPDPHENPPDARFCEQCRAPTVYFKKHEVLKSYEDILKESDEDYKPMYSPYEY
jgi:hypothetical protein